MSHKIQLSDFNTKTYPDAFVEIFETQSWAEKQKIDSAGAKVLELGEDDQYAEVDQLKTGLAVLETSVIRWEGVCDRQGGALPANKKGFTHKDFRPAMGEWLVNEIVAFYAEQERSETESLDLDETSPAPSSEAREAATPAAASSTTSPSPTAGREPVPTR